MQHREKVMAEKHREKQGRQRPHHREPYQRSRKAVWNEDDDADWRQATGPEPDRFVGQSADSDEQTVSNLPNSAGPTGGIGRQQDEQPANPKT